MRDTVDHGRSLDNVLAQYLNFVKPSYEQYCLPTKKYADVIIPRGADNQSKPEAKRKILNQYVYFINIYLFKLHWT